MLSDLKKLNQLNLTTESQEVCSPQADKMIQVTSMFLVNKNPKLSRDVTLMAHGETEDNELSKYITLAPKESLHLDSNDILTYLKTPSDKMYAKISGQSLPIAFNRWETKTPLIRRLGHKSAKVGNDVYVQSKETFNPNPFEVTDSKWDQLAYNGKIYHPVTDGVTTAYLKIYNTETGEITNSATFNLADKKLTDLKLWDLMLSFDKLYIYGWYSTTNNLCRMFKYTIGSNTWASLAPETTGVPLGSFGSVLILRGNLEYVIMMDRTNQRIGQYKISDNSWYYTANGSVSVDIGFHVVNPNRSSTSADVRVIVPYSSGNNYSNVVLTLNSSTYTANSYQISPYGNINVYSNYSDARCGNKCKPDYTTDREVDIEYYGYFILAEYANQDRLSLYRMFNNNGFSSGMSAYRIEPYVNYNGNQYYYAMSTVLSLLWAVEIGSVSRKIFLSASNAIGLDFQIRIPATTWSDPLTYDIYQSDNQFDKYTITNDTWTEDLTTTSENDISSSMCSDGSDFIYAVSSSNKRRLLVYDVTNDTWDESGLALASSDVDDLLYNNGKIYAKRKSDYKMIIYDVDLDTWDESGTGDMCFDWTYPLHYNGDIYVKRISNGEVMKYNIADDLWSFTASLAVYHSPLMNSDGRMYGRGATANKLFIYDSNIDSMDSTNGLGTSELFTDFLPHSDNDGSYGFAFDSTNGTLKVKKYLIPRYTPIDGDVILTAYGVEEDIQ